MKNIYLDWNLYSILKKPTQNAHIILRDFLYNNRERINLFYSDAHINDLRQTSRKSKEELLFDLKYLSEITGNNCLVNYFGIKNVTNEKRKPKEFYESICTEQSARFIKIVTWLNNLILNRYGNLRNFVARKQLKVDAREISNMSKEQLDELVKQTKQYQNLNELFLHGLTLRGPNAKLSYIDYYYTAYTSLDLISYFPDKMAKKGSFENLKNDALHSAYGSLCDSFITNDKKCFYKSRFLFSYYDSKSILIKTSGVKDECLFQQQLNEIMK